MKKILLALVLVVLLSFGVSAAWQDLVYQSWSFEEGADSLTIQGSNSSVVPYNLTLIGGTAGTAPMQYGNGRILNGSNYFRENSLTFQIGGSFTVCVDMARQNQTGIDNNFWLGVNSGASYLQFSVRQDGSSNAQFQYRTATNDEYNSPHSPSLNESEITLCYVRNNDDARSQIYLDGIIAQNDTNHFGSAINITSTDFYIGAVVGLRPINASYDELYIWQRALNGQELLEFATRQSQESPLTASNFNVTSAYLNGTVWNTNQNSSAFTYDATPTVTFTLSNPGNCTISTLAGDYNGTVGNDSNTLCATTNSSSQSCTLPVSKRLVKGNQFAYVACKSQSGLFYYQSGQLNITLDHVIINNQTYNVTNAYLNATAWRINENNTVFMRNRMPIVHFNTSFESNCSISRYQLNYTQMVANDSNSACELDDMNITHACELPSSMPLLNGVQFLYISCLSIGAEPNGGQSTSLPLNISMDRRIVAQVIIQNGSGNSSYNKADVYAVNQADNITVDKGYVNSTGGIELFVPNAGTYLIWGYDKSNSSVEGDIKNHVVIP